MSLPAVAVIDPVLTALSRATEPTVVVMLSVGVLPLSIGELEKTVAVLVSIPLNDGSTWATMVTVTTSPTAISPTWQIAFAQAAAPWPLRRTVALRKMAP